MQHHLVQTSQQIENCFIKPLAQTIMKMCEICRCCFEIIWSQQTHPQAKLSRTRSLSCLQATGAPKRIYFLLVIKLVEYLCKMNTRDAIETEIAVNDVISRWFLKSCHFHVKFHQSRQVFAMTFTRHEWYRQQRTHHQVLILWKKYIQGGPTKTKLFYINN